MWLNRDAAKFGGMPAYYYLASTQPLADIASPETLARYGIGISNLEPSSIGSHHDPAPFRLAALRHLQKIGLYAETPGSIDFLSENLFRTHVPVPANVPRGEYNVEVYLFRNGNVVSAQSTPLFIDQTGLKTFVKTADRLAQTYGARFTPPQLLRDMAAKGETFYGKFSGKKAAA